MSTPVKARRSVPKAVWELPLGRRIKWARETAGLSHDRLVASIGRSNRGHLIKIEKGIHLPQVDLREAIADATNVPRDLFADEDDEEDRLLALELLNVIRQIRAQVPA